MRMWSQFANRQKKRFVPIPPDANRRVLSETAGERCWGGSEGAICCIKGQATLLTARPPAGLSGLPDPHAPPPPQYQHLPPMSRLPPAGAARE